MKQAEFLNLETKQVQWLDASLEHPNLVKVPEGAETITTYNSGNCVNFWKDNGDSWFSGMNNCWKQWWCMDSHINNHGHTIIWQRNSLQEKIDEALSVLNVSKAQLSVLLGREKSYVKRLLAKGRNVTENTKVAVIDQLEQLIRVHEYEQKAEVSKCIGELTVGIGVDIVPMDDIKREMHLKNVLLDQVNKDSLSWMYKFENQRNLSWFLTLVVVVMAFVWIYSVWGV